jgi:hypothetical protein
VGPRPWKLSRIGNMRELLLALEIAMGEKAGSLIARQVFL